LQEKLGIEKGRKAWEDIVEFMSGRRPSECPADLRNQPGTEKCLALIYQGEDAVRKIREVLGPTDPAKAPHGTIRREWRHFDMVLPSVFGSGTLRKVDGAATAGSVHASYRVGGQRGFAATPFLGFNYADSNIDDLPIDAFSTYSPGKDKTKVGQAGVRVSYRAGSDDHVVIEPFASASELKNWSRSDRGTFSFGTPVTTFALDTVTWDDARRYSVGVMGHARNGRVSAFVVGNFDDGSDLHGFTLNAGIRFNF